jgi:hypothetical protein
VLYAIADLDAWLEASKYGPAVDKPDAEPRVSKAGANHTAYS